MKKNNIKLNYIYTLIFQVFSFITPLITTPYISRIFSPEGIGRFSFTSSVISYFCIFAALGFSIYAQREIAKCEGDKKSQSIIFWGVFVCKAIFGMIAFVVCWVIICFNVFERYTVLMKIMSIEIIASIFNIVYLFQGNEKFGIITIRDFIIKVVGIAAIFLFVKTPDDLPLYAFCNAGTSLVSALSLWLCLKNDIVFVKIREIKPQKYILPSLKLFIPTIAISIYTLLDKTLIGILIPDEIADIENGYYMQAEKIIKIAMMVLSSLGTVMLPRNSKELAAGNEDGFLKNIYNAIEFVFFIGAPMALGIMSISKNFSPCFFGDGYDKVPILMMIFALMIIPAGLGNVLGQQYMLPKGEDNKYILAYIISAVLNFSLNMILIPALFSYGAAIASVIAELLAFSVMMYFLKNKISMRYIIRNNWKPCVAALVMFIIVYSTSWLLESTIVNTCVLIVEGIVVYVLMTLCLKCKTTRELMKIIRRKVIRKKNG